MAKTKSLKKPASPMKKTPRPAPAAGKPQAVVKKSAPTAPPRKPAPPAEPAAPPAAEKQGKKPAKPALAPAPAAAAPLATAIITKGLPPAPAEDTRVKVSVIKPEPKPNGAEPLTDAQLRKVKTNLTRKDLEQYHHLLALKRAELLGDVESLKNDAKNNAGSSISYEHMADTGSDNYEQEFTLGLVESERKLLQEIDEAITRIKNGTFGVCLEKGVPINRARLDAKPWAKYCIEVARDREKRGLPG